MKKKILLTTSMLFLVSLAVTGCSFLLDYLDYGTPSDSDFDVDKVDVNGKTVIQQTYKNYSECNIYNLDYCPTSGNINLLIIPVWFSDSTKYVESSKKETVRNDIRTAYLGTNEETGWRSVKTYYEELSNNKLTIGGTVTDWYVTTYSSKQVGANDYLTDELVTSSVDWYFSNNPSDKKSNYDSDKNGYIDAVMLIYAAADYSTLDDSDLSNLWAYCYWLQEENSSSTPIPNAYFWASYDFMYSSGTFLKPTPAGSKYGSGDNSHTKIDAHTYIHEMGHVFGLEDYYDYSSEKYCPAGGFSMQDYNVGSHDPYSTMALGWANPYVVTGNAEVSIGTFQKTRDVILISEKWNGIGSPFDEYILLELYSPTGLNELDSRYTYDSSIKGPNSIGIRMWHVDARLVYSNDYKTIIDGGEQYNIPVYSSKNFTSNVKDSRAKYGIHHAFSNTYDDESYGSVLGSDFYNYNILQLIRNKNSFRKSFLKNKLETSDLFTSGLYQLSTYKDQFVKNSPFKMNNGSFANWKIKINISGSGDDATAKIEIVK